MLPPDTTATIFPVPARPLSAAAIAVPPAPSATMCTRSAVLRMAAAMSSSGMTIEPSTRSLSSGHIVGSTDLPPAPSTNDGFQASKRLASPRRSDSSSGAAVSGSAA